jgi:hypothetical protein
MFDLGSLSLHFTNLNQGSVGFLDSKVAFVVAMAFKTALDSLIKEPNIGSNFHQTFILFTMNN